MTRYKAYLAHDGGSGSSGPGRRRDLLIGLVAVGLALGLPLQASGFNAADSPALRDAGGRDHPSVSAVRHERPITADEVYAVRATAEGITVLSHWYPAAGVTPDELRASLRAQGTQGVLSAGEIPLPCEDGRGAPKVGTAAAWCIDEPGDHKWAYGPFNDPQVYFLDHSSASWPVTDARADWWQAPGIDAYYRWYTQGCPGGGRHCVHVYSGPYPDTWLGKTDVPMVTDTGYFIDGKVTIYLNDRTTPNTYAARRAVACHEMGHALGMAHNLSLASCMFSGSPTFPQHPTTDDFGVLNLLYPKPGT